MRTLQAQHAQMTADPESVQTRSIDAPSHTHFAVVFRARPQASLPRPRGWVLDGMKASAWPECTSVLRAHTAEVASVAFSLDGALLASLSGDGAMGPASRRGATAADARRRCVGHLRGLQS